MGVKNLFRLCLPVFILFLNKATFSQSISTDFFGQNAWMPDTIGTSNACAFPPCVLYGKLHKHWDNIKVSGTNVVRFGGIAPDKNRPTNFQYIKMIDSIRAKGMEPLIQVPYYNNQYTAQQAAAIVQYINITKGKNVKYWSIGNEPDLVYSHTSAAQVAAYFKPFASAMKAVDPGILIVGPDCAWYNTNIINGLTTPNGPDDITGTDSNGRYYCDIISFHHYPFNGSQTRAQVISKLTSAGGLDNNLAALNNRINNCNSVHNRIGASALRTALTEANVNWQNSGTDNLNGVGANSFLGGQFIAEMLGVGMKNKMGFMNIWSVIEGNNTQLNIGYIDKTSGNRKPLFYHYQMLADNFKGSFINGADNLANVKAFGSQDASEINVMVMNQDLGTDYNFTLRLNAAAVSGNNPLKININAGVNSEYNDQIQNQTSILLTFNNQGALIKKCVYSLANHAAFNLPPGCETFNILPVELVSFKAESVENEKVLLNWETATEINNEFFTVQRSRDGFNFEDVITVKGAGTSSKKHFYEQTDELPYNGLSYYRLKQTDFGGSIAYSNVQSVYLNKYLDEVIVYPNPNNGSLIKARFRDLPENSNLSAKLYGPQGREIAIRYRKTDGELEIVPHSNLPRGLYIVLISANNSVYRKKIIVK